MTNEQAIYEIRKLVDKYLQNVPECLEVAVDALERQIPNPVDGQFKGKCPHCAQLVFPHMKYCDKCGQALEWGE